MVNVPQTAQSDRWMSSDALLSRIAKMQDVMKRVMKEGKHYAVLPGCKELSLLQPGSQLLSTTFKIGHEPDSVEDLSVPGVFRYRVRDRVFDIGSSATLTYGVGECSSAEDKYAWRAAITDDEYESFEIENRRLKHKKTNQGKPYTIKQVRTNPADVANTVLKMARKRANVNGTIEALAASELFTQDIEDLPDGMDLQGDANKKSTKPENIEPTKAAKEEKKNEKKKDDNPDAATRKANKWISEAQEKRLYALCKEHNVKIENLKAHMFAQFNLNHLHEISWQNKQYDTICIAIQEKPDLFARYEKPAEKQQDAPADRGFADILQASATAAGIDENGINAILQEKYGYEKASDVPQAQMSVIIDYFNSLAETK